MKKRSLILWICLVLCCVCFTALADENFLIDNRKVVLFEGETFQLGLLRQGTAAEEGILTWSSSNMRIASVDSNGLVTALSKGSATITATLKVGKRSFKSTASVTVKRPVTGITVKDSALTVLEASDPQLQGLMTLDSDLPVLLLYAGTEARISASVIPKDASTTSVKITSADQKVLKNNQGTLLPQAAGETILTVASASNPEIRKEYHVFVAQKATKVTVTAGKKSIAVGGQTQLTAEVAPASATWKDVTWSSQTPKIVTVDENGLVTGLAKGEGHLRATATDGSKRYGEIIVKVEQMPSSIALNESKLRVVSELDPLVEGLLNEALDLPVLVMYNGQTVTVSATVAPENASNKKYTITSGNENVVKPVSGQQHELRAVAAGETTMTVACAADPDVAVQYHVFVAQRATKITASVDQKTIFVGGVTSATASVQPDNATWTDVTWSSQTPKIVSVNENGVVTGLAKGEGRLRATAKDGSGRYGDVVVTVAQQPTGITLKGNSKVVVGRSVNLTATVLPSNANNKKVTWTSSDSQIATVNASGRVTGVRAGACVITCTSQADGTVYATQPMTVVQLVEKIAFNVKQTQVNVPESTRVSWTVEPYDATDRSVTLSSNNSKIATVDQDGTIHAVKAGECTITAKANDGSGVAGRVKVTVLQPVWGVHMKQTSVRVGVDETLKLQAVLEPSDASNRHMSWSVVDPRLASISGTGTAPTVKGLAWGTTSVVGITEDGGYVTSCTVNVGRYSKAIRINDFYLQSNKIKITLKNLSNMNITRVYFTIQCFDMINNPLPCTTNGLPYFAGYYMDPLYEGQFTTHGRFHFDHFSQPSAPIGRIVITLTGYQCDNGFSYSYESNAQPSMEYTSQGWVIPTPVPTPSPVPTFPPVTDDGEPAKG